MLSTSQKITMSSYWKHFKLSIYKNKNKCIHKLTDQIGRENTCDPYRPVLFPSLTPTPMILHSTENSHPDSADTGVGLV